MPGLMKDPFNRDRLIIVSMSMALACLPKAHSPSSVDRKPLMSSELQPPLTCSKFIFLKDEKFLLFSVDE